MRLHTHQILKNIVTIVLVAMFFSCTNSSKEVRAFFTSQNLPIGEAKDMTHVYKDSGRVTSKMYTALLRDFSNRKEHPYNEFPQGIKLVTYETKNDSVTILGDYCLTYTKTRISELKGNVIILNHTDKSKLVTEQLFWDQNTDYLYSEKKFQFTTPQLDTINGVGFESKKDLTKFLAKQMSGQVITSEN